jgi:glycosyltransferase involved in cell wall biosynthesis
MSNSSSETPVTSQRQPLVSVVIPTFNRNKFIERCVLSVLDQTYKNVECLVMDGGSTDGSVETLNRLSKEDPRLRFFSKPDEGEVYATNEGFDLARGEIMGVQASDDFYEKDAIEHAVGFLLDHPEFIGVSGDARYVDESGKSLHRGVITYRGEMSKDKLRRILILRHKSTFVCHGAFFGWRTRLLSHGKLDPQFSVMPDLEFYSRLLDQGEQIGSVRRVQYNFTIHPGMGALKYAAKVQNQRVLLHERFEMKWYHELLWMIVGKVSCYLMNPYRSPFFQGVVWELRMLKATLRNRLLSKKIEPNI